MKKTRERELRLKLKIGSRLKRLRMEKNLTQKELAVMVSGGLDYTYIGKIERGEQLPSLKILLKISDALSVPVATFFQDELFAAASDIASSELRYLISEETGRQLVEALKLVDKEDFPLLIEIIQVLGRHRKTTKSDQEEETEQEPAACLLAAETMTSYRK
ncbi:helix-turn-helix transcriptional regulator [Geotalea toluenoxydans]|uniref:helix-turn-helix domain-containing protein n=1 Tax=Geotalea toluenoxydans TaxID=421624 RepID=UPI001FB27068|nr:helix-turn-helix transcriptional regulator [Geotalea toluenoxydans]